MAFYGDGTERMGGWEGWCDAIFLECGIVRGEGRRVYKGYGWGGLRRRGLDGGFILVMIRVMRFLWEWKDIKVLEMV